MIGAALIPIYYLLFRTLILKFDIKTPGRNAAVKMFTKADFNVQANATQAGQATNANVAVSPKRDRNFELAQKVIMAYGGASNIRNVDACITKLRVQVVNPSIVQKDKLMELGARGVINPSAQSVYAVFGVDADLIKNCMNEILTSGA